MLGWIYQYKIDANVGSCPLPPCNLFPLVSPHPQSLLTPWFTLTGVESPTHEIRADADPSARSAKSIVITLANKHTFDRPVEILIHPSGRWALLPLCWSCPSLGSSSVALETAGLALVLQILARLGFSAYPGPSWGFLSCPSSQILLFPQPRVPASLPHLKCNHCCPSHNSLHFQSLTCPTS